MCLRKFLRASVSALPATVSSMLSGSASQLHLGVAPSASKIAIERTAHNGMIQFLLGIESRCSPLVTFVELEATFSCPDERGEQPNAERIRTDVCTPRHRRSCGRTMTAV